MLSGAKLVTRLAATTGNRAVFASTSMLAPVARYHERVIDHYEKPRNVGSLDKNDPAVGTGVVGAPACGDVMKIQILIEDGIVKESRFKTFGCGSAIASSSYVTELIKNKTIDEVKQIKNSEIAKYLALPPVKLHCSMLAEDAIKAAIKDYEAKKQLREAKQQQNQTANTASASATAN
eukprot:TRINITY_DN15594_c0_g1_i1.p1 TRINITY_DN15594_c0_g1~~TRINITY_DN15594_c0_g1_i1.p1  ORF type:complete len:178 (-),score=44.93 TRINITY_DN15594_c0_g1_i1:200-733(-)